jgi:hypothetical protein
MPEKDSGNVTVTIAEEYYIPLSKRAEENNRSIKGELQAILKAAGVVPVALTIASRRSK